MEFWLVIGGIVKRRVSLVGEAGRHQTMQDLIGKLKSLVFKNMRSHYRVLSKRVA